MFYIWDNLSKDPSRTATIFAAELAKAIGRNKCPDIAPDLDSFSRRIHGCILIVCAHGCNTENGFKDKQDWDIYSCRSPKEKGLDVVMDIDFRPDQWRDVRYFGVAIRSAMYAVDIVMGTQDEINPAMLADPKKDGIFINQFDSETHAVQLS